MLKDSNAVLCILEESGRGTKNEQILKLSRHSLSSGVQTVRSSTTPCLVRPANLAYIIYTSGTTGKPKGMMIEHKNVVRLLFNDGFQFDFDNNDVWSLFHSFSFDFSVWEMYGALLYGGRLVIIPPMTARDPGEFLQVLKKEKVTVLNQTPSAFYRLVEEELKVSDRDLSVKVVVFGGEALKPAQLAHWKNRYPKTMLINMYGITETTVHVTYKEIGEGEINSGISNIGQPIPTLSVYVMDPGLNLQPMGVPGQCCVGGEGVGRGYLNRVELTSEKFLSNPYIPDERLYLSGDLVRRLDNGEMEYLGRIDSQVKVRGYRVELGEIENQLLEQADNQLKDALVMMKMDKEEGGYLCAYVVPAKGEIDINRLRNDLSQKLPAYMIPSYFISLEQIPLTPNGKVDKTALPLPRISLGSQYAAPRDQLEEKLAEIWQRILGVERVGIEDDFFSLGGDSIKALRLVSSINDELESDLKLIDLYTSGIIKALSRQVTTGKDIERVRRTKKVAQDMDRLKTKILANVKDSKDFEDIFPLSDIQNGLVYHYLKHTGSGLYHDQFVLPVNYVNFELNRFKQALKLVVKKHGILRTGFNIEDFKEPVQMVRKEVVLNFDYLDISHLDTKGQEQLIGSFLTEDLATPFQVDDSPLWRFKLFSRGNGYFVVVFIFHHAILDGWSTASMMAEMHNTYLRLKTSPGYVPSSLGCTYKDSVIAEIVDKESSQTIDFWKNELLEYKRTDFTETLKYDRQKRGMVVYRTIVDGEIIIRLRDTAGRHGTGLKNLCFSAYLFVMDMLTHESDLVVGLVTNNRPLHEDGDKVLGCFLNTVPVRMQIPTGITWGGYIKLMERKLQNLRPHERLPLFEIARVIEERNKNRNPIFDTLFNFTDFHIFSETDIEENSEPGAASGQSGAPDVPVEELSLTGSEMTNTLFDFEVDITSGDLVIHPKYDPASISDALVQKSCTYFERVLNKFIHEQDNLLSKNAVLPSEEKQQLLIKFNATSSPYSTDQTMHGLFQNQVDRTPNHIALTGGNPNTGKYEIRNSKLHFTHLTYGKLNREANQLAHTLRENGVTTGDLVVVIMHRSIHMVIAVMAILKSGGAYVPLEPYLPDTRIQKILDSLRAGVLLTDDKEYHRVKVMGESLKALDTILCPDGKDHTEIATHPVENPGSKVKVSPLDFAYTIFTSGSTGTPKGVVETHQPVVNVIEWVNRTFNIGHPDKLLFVASLGFDLSVYDIFGILASGAGLRVVEAEDIKSPERLLEIIFREGVTFWDSAPAALQQLVPFLDDLSDSDIRHSMRLVFLSGDWIPVTMPDALKEAFPGVQVISLGGATEATIWSNFHPILEVDPRWPSIPYGKPIQNAKYYILDQHLETCPICVPGDLYIGGECLASGYLNDPELTAGKFINYYFSLQSTKRSQRNSLNDNPSAVQTIRLYKTGDIARWHTDGNMEFLGRKDYQVKVRGFRIELGEIESQLINHQDVESAIVIVLKDYRGDNFLSAYFVSPTEIGKDELIHHLAHELPEYMIPQHIIQLEQIPLTPNGKVDRKSLPVPDMMPGSRKYHPARDEIEEKLVGIWSEILHITKDSISIDDNFFELGGHSLNATLVISKIKKELNVKIPLAEVFSAATVRKLAESVRVAEVEKYEAIEAVEKRNYYPLSPAQKRLYFLHRVNPGSISYNIPEALIFQGELDPDKLENIFQRLILRHETFRTSFTMVAGEPVQRIHEPGSLEFTLNYYEMDEANADQFVADFCRPFDFSSPPLLRGALIKIGIERYILAFDLLHIIADGIAFGILVRDFMDLYEGKDLADLKLQYKDFSQWQNGPGGRRQVEQQQQYWLKRFDGKIPMISLPTDYARPLIQNFEGETVRFVLDKKESLLLSELALTREVSIFMVLLAAFNIMLSKISGSEDIIVGTGTAGRRHESLNEVIGMFVNTLALRNTPRSNQTFLEFLDSLKKNTLDDFENQDYPFEDLVENLELKRDTSRNPLFDVLFQLNNFEFSELEVAGLRVRSYQHEWKISKFDLTLWGWEGEEQLIFSIEYATHLFKQETIDLFIRYFKEIITAVIQNPQTPLGLLKQISRENKEALLQSLNNEVEEEIKRIARKEQVLQNRLDRSFLKFEHHIAVEYGSRTLSYNTLNRLSDRIASGILSRESSKGSVIGVLMDNRMELICTALGILKTGCIFVPLDTSYPRSRLELMIELTGMNLIIADSAHVNLFVDSYFPENVKPEIIFFDDWLTTKETEEFPTLRLPDIEYQPDDRIYIYFTSGSTGTPKAILGKNRSLVHFIDWEIETFNIDETYRFSQLTTPGFDAFLRDLFVPLVSGGTVCIPQNKEIQLEGTTLHQWLENSGVHLISCVPSLFRLLSSRQLTQQHFRDLKVILLSGERITAHDLGNWFSTFKERIQLANLWGTSETTLAKTCHIVREEDLKRERIPVGRPIRGASVFVLDESLEICDSLMTGQLYIRTPFRSFGYYNDPQANRERFIPNPFSSAPDDLVHRTGDMGRVLLDGSIDLLGRNDRQIKVHGIRIEPGEIETVLQKHPSVIEAIVVKKRIVSQLHAEIDNGFLCAYVTVTGKLQPENSGGTFVDPSILAEYMRETLPVYMVPSRIIVIDDIPKTPNGKIDYKALTIPGDDKRDFIAPTSRIERKILELWREILKLDSTGISITDSFFALGGNSLNIITFISRIHQEFDVKIPLIDIFNNPSIREQAELILCQTPTEKYFTIEPVEKRDYYPMSSAQKRLYFLYRMDMSSTSYNMPFNRSDG